MRKDLLDLTIGLILFCVLGATLGCDCLCGAKPSSKAVAAPAALAVPGKPAVIEPGKPWHFAVSGDSRNCGDVVMPAIAQGAARDQAQFYWHLGDLRAIYDFDEDMMQDFKLKGKEHVSILAYETTAWDDFAHQQTVPFGNIPFFLGIGNHETIAPMSTRDMFETKFASFLDQTKLHDQRVSDAHGGQPAAVKTYFHWVMDGVDFIYLDNASEDQFDDYQMKWFEERMKADEKTGSGVDTLVVGMHAALPESISRDHSMNQWLDHPWVKGVESGTAVYKRLLQLRDSSKKKVYVLASHSHYYMEDIFNTQYWRSNGGVLKGWIIGTAGAQRYALPQPNAAKDARTNVYGYLLGTVDRSQSTQDTIQFQFKQLDEKDIPPAIVHGYGQEFVHWCFAENTKAKPGASSTSEH